MIGLGVWLGWKEGGAGGVVSWGGGGENRWPVRAIAPPAISGAWAEGKNIKSPRKNISCLEARLAGPEAAVPLGPGHVRVAAGARVRGRADILQETPHLGHLFFICLYPIILLSIIAPWRGSPACPRPWRGRCSCRACCRACRCPRRRARGRSGTCARTAAPCRGSAGTRARGTAGRWPALENVGKC